ncbi:hypothetical protein LGM38_32370 [Burkholderia vietnamiensis]|uniref:hypothetical protein n=1 Tax=Burkholderia vietnamiensis TaxID=60552 RepID=UPI00158B2B0A|nr:hypothetical protein [Burkholderia vietnamiensis]MCA8016737.1 hypothetical protein [Burkholderia vietnamiensis]MCB4347904.1 hypothetical protein [Burkholderia vietnamiensis]
MSAGERRGRRERRVATVRSRMTRGLELGRAACVLRRTCGFSGPHWRPKTGALRRSAANDLTARGADSLTRVALACRQDMCRSLLFVRPPNQRRKLISDADDPVAVVARPVRLRIVFADSFVTRIARNLLAVRCSLDRADDPKVVVAQIFDCHLVSPVALFGLA